jgi:hypothetical protein
VQWRPPNVRHSSFSIRFLIRAPIHLAHESAFKLVEGPFKSPARQIRIPYHVFVGQFARRSTGRLAVSIREPGSRSAGPLQRSEQELRAKAVEECPPRLHKPPAENSK